MNKNDERIIDLRNKLEEKREWLKNNKPQIKLNTNCIFTMFGLTYNLHVMNEFELEILYSWLLGLDNDKLILNGYEVKSWLEDIKTILIKQDYYKQASDIDKISKRLEQLMSNDCKVEIELDELSKLI